MRQQNIDFQTTILSRFDMIFIVKDEHNEQRDRVGRTHFFCEVANLNVFMQMIAKHVMNIHMNRTNEGDENGEIVGEIDVDKMKKFIAYCKAYELLRYPFSTHRLTPYNRKCAPRLSAEAQEMLSSHFVALRKQVKQFEQDNDERSSIPITIRCVLPACRDVLLLIQIMRRQLEAIIRISESLAKLTLSPVVQNHHVEEAIRLFKFSTMDAVSAGSVDGMSRGALNEEMNKIEKEIRRRLPIGWSTSYQSLVREFVTQQTFSSHALERTLFMLEKREIIRFSGQVRSWYVDSPSWLTGKFLRPSEKDCAPVSHALRAR